MSDIVYIKWTDAITRDTGWMSKDQCISWAEGDKWEVETVGFLLKETKKYILVSLQQSATAMYDSDGDVKGYGHLFKIPTTWILEKKILKKNSKD